MKLQHSVGSLYLQECDNFKLHRSATTLNHLPNIVQVHAFGTKTGMASTRPQKVCYAKTLEANPLRPASCEVKPPEIVPACPAHPTNA